MNREIYIYNTLTRTKERFVPRSEGEVSIYVCGVTPYDEAHLGHARPSVFFDVVRRYLEFMGYTVHLVQNFTDVDDKIIERAKAEGLEPLELAATYSERYLASMDRLGVQRAVRYPKVSEHIDEIIEMIEGLVEKGAAYESEGNVFFRVEAFPGYGKLSNQQKDELVAGARIEPGEGKESPLDFALWKAAKPGEPAWPSPWGPGRPGWHIECSAMSLKYLGSGFDIHGGGLDLIFPHHENEIAQSEAYTGSEPFVRYWMHNGLVNFGKEKMSKSLGNFVTVDALVDEYGAALIRYLIVQQHYRSPMEFDDEQIAQARRGWERLNRAYAELVAMVPTYSIEEAEAAQGDPALVARARETVEKFIGALADDFNTPVALASLFELVRDARAHVGTTHPDELSEATRVGLGAVRGVLEQLGGDILDILSLESVSAKESQASDELVGALVQLLLDVRQEARAARNFAQADQIRDRLAELGIEVQDSPEGPKWRFTE